MKKNKIAIIGGGSSGLFLANLLTDVNADVFLLEKNNKLGKKILASGNGKCNFTNVYDLKEKYNDDFANLIIDKFNVNETLMYFENKGLIYKNDSKGRCYPVSECAASVLDCLKKDLKKVVILLETEVKQVRKNAESYEIKYGDKKDLFDIVAFCSGSCSSNLGSTKAYEYFKNLGLSIEELSPSLVPVLVKENIRGLKGVRVKCPVKLINECGMVVYQEDGEVMFKEDALSGIAIFNASSYINRKEGKYKISLDLSAGLDKIALYEYINKRKNEYPNVFKGFLNDKLAEYIINKSNFKLDNQGIYKLVDQICDLTFDVIGLYPFLDSQVCSGGIKLSEIKENLELKKYSNIYVAGEVMDVDGISGGYNLQFAWSSAAVVAKDIIRKLGEIKD